MDKRMISVFAAFSLFIGCCCLRLYVVCSKGTEYVSSASRYFSVDLCKIRGEITDCSGERLVDADYDNIVVAKPTLRALNSLSDVLDSEAFAAAKERMSKQNAVCVNIGKNEIVQNTDALAVKVNRRYAKNQPAVHLIGYLNGSGHGVSGIENSFDSLLYTDANLTARLHADVAGRIISGAQIEIINTNRKTAGVRLTLDLRIQTAVENAMDMCEIKRGAVIVTDVKTGAIRAMASRPVYDPNNVAESLDSEDSPFVNRGLSAYSVGSVFKAVVAAAALEEGIDNFNYVCTGSCRVGDITFHCNDRKAHGNLNMQKALECSCNSYFIELAQKIGADDLLAVAKKLGFGQGNSLADGIFSQEGVLPLPQELENPGALANFSFGQGSFSATLIQMAQAMSAIANGGKYCRPYLVESVTDASGKTSGVHIAGYPVVALKKSTSEKLTEMLVSVVENGNASRAKLYNNVSAAGKTATAQTGTYYKNGVEICNTWFGGFFPADSPRYAVVIIKQGGSSGAMDCAPVFKKIGDKIMSFD